MKSRLIHVFLFFYLFQNFRSGEEMGILYGRTYDANANLAAGEIVTYVRVYLIDKSNAIFAVRNIINGYY